MAGRAAAQRAAAAGAGAGDVVATVESTTVNHLPVYNNTSGTAIKTSGKAIANVSFVNEAETRSAAIDLADNQLKQAELKDWSETATTSATSGAVTLNYTLSNVFSATLTGDVTSITITNPPQTGKSGTVVWIVTQNATTAKTIALPTGGVWASGATPDFSTLGAVYILTFKTINAGANWVVTSAGGGAGLSGLSAGGILFGGADGKATQDATNLYWSSANKRMGINTDNPSNVVSISPVIGSIIDIAPEAVSLSGSGASVVALTDDVLTATGVAVAGGNYGLVFSNPRYIKGIDFYAPSSPGTDPFPPKNYKIQITHDGSTWVDTSILTYSGTITSVTDNVAYHASFSTAGWCYLTIPPAVVKGIRLYMTAIWGNQATISELVIWGTALTYSNIASQAAGVVTTGSVATYTNGDPSVAVGTQFTNGSFGLYFSSAKSVNKIRFAS